MAEPTRLTEGDVGWAVDLSRGLARAGCLQALSAVLQAVTVRLDAQVTAPQFRPAAWRPGDVSWRDEDGHRAAVGGAHVLTNATTWSARGSL